MEQSIELMRKRHAYYTKLIADYGIHTAKEFYDELHEMFAMFGVDVTYGSQSCSIYITCEDYDYEWYSVSDGSDGGLATVSQIVEWRDSFSCHEEVDIFADADDHEEKRTPITFEELKKLRSQKLGRKK